MGIIRDVGRALLQSRARRRALGRAMIELGLARMRLRDDHAHHLRNPARALGAAGGRLTSTQARVVDDVAFALPRVAARVPWRADCLVQALAGERWLRHHGIDSRIVIGVRKDDAAALDAHAWLEADQRIVTGGDIGAFVPLTR